MGRCAWGVLVETYPDTSLLISTPRVTASLSIASPTSPFAYASDVSTIDLYGSSPDCPIFDTNAGFVVASVMASPATAQNSEIFERSAVSIESTVMRASCGRADLAPIDTALDRAAEVDSAVAVAAQQERKSSLIVPAFCLRFQSASCFDQGFFGQMTKPLPVSAAHAAKIS